MMRCVQKAVSPGGGVLTVGILSIILMIENVLNVCTYNMYMNSDTIYRGHCCDTDLRYNIVSLKVPSHNIVSSVIQHDVLRIEQFEWLITVITFLTLTKC